MTAVFPIRDATRLPDYDYSTPGAYFVTVCTHKRIDYFENPDCVRICREVWDDMVNHHSVRLDEFVAMPDHVHFIIWIVRRGEACLARETGDAGVSPTIGESELTDRRVEACLDRPHGSPPDSLPTIVGSFKSAVTRRIRAELEIGFGWQRSFYDHVIRNEIDLTTLRDYILNNPKELETAEFTPVREGLCALPKNGSTRRCSPTDECPKPITKP